MTDEEFLLLGRAVESGDLRTARRLLESGVDANGVDPEVGSPGVTPAVLAGNAQMILLFRHFGADVELVDETGATALSSAASLRTDRGQPPEDLALAAGHYDIYSV